MDELAFGGLCVAGVMVVCLIHFLYSESKRWMVMLAVIGVCSLIGAFGFWMFGDAMSTLGHNTRAGAVLNQKAWCFGVFGLIAVIVGFRGMTKACEK